MNRTGRVGQVVCAAVVPVCTRLASAINAPTMKVFIMCFPTLFDNVGFGVFSDLSRRATG
jgi:hypothetical protein